MTYIIRKRLLPAIIFTQTLICISGIVANGNEPLAMFTAKRDSIERQMLYNGRVWRNLYSKIRGDQFLFSNDFVPGTVTISNNLFKVDKLKYDIYNDELLIVTDKGIILQLNKEVTDRFSLDFPNKSYRFKRIDRDSTNDLNGYVNVLYEGNVSLFVRYKKSILLLAVDNKYDIFDQVQKIYLKKGNELFTVNSRRIFFNLLKDHKQQVKSFMRSGKIRVSKVDPESFVPVVKYYDNLLNQNH
jgi:hypothetical protein